MAERASIFQGVQIGVEATPGTGVAANKRLPSLSIEPSPKVETKTFRAMGNKFASLVVPAKELVQAKLSGPVTYDEIVYLLSSLLSYSAPVQQGATAAYLWTHAPAVDQADTIKTFTVEQGGAVRAHKFVHGLVTGLSLEFSPGGVELSGDMIGKALVDDVVMTAAPSSVALMPVLPFHLNVYLADAYAGLATALPLNRALSVSWELTDRFGPLYALKRAAGTSFDAVVEIEPKLSAKLKLEADDEGMEMLETLRAGDTRFLRIEAIGETIEDDEEYSLIIDTAVKVSDVSEFSDVDGVFALEWSLTGVYDPTWGKATQVDVVNTLTAL
jgi:hypothetical protein